mmetsp:Transcript_61700/g.147125  ORF Transcript_61700/g.147125 Transcript_61700/m.147125 type:complete len:207 (+) Transcript_61700:90-710(+)
MSMGIGPSSPPSPGSFRSSGSTPLFRAFSRRVTSSMVSASAMAFLMRSMTSGDGPDLETSETFSVGSLPTTRGGAISSNSFLPRSPANSSVAAFLSLSLMRLKSRILRVLEHLWIIYGRKCFTLVTGLSIRLRRSRFANLVIGSRSTSFSSLLPVSTRLTSCGSGSKQSGAIRLILLLASSSTRSLFSGGKFPNLMRSLSDRSKHS